MRKIIILAALVVIVGIQFIPVQRNNPPVYADIQAEPQVKAILQRACFDCHSNDTVWPWYSRVAPVSWVLAHHVKEGRGHINFSDWGSYPLRRQARIAEESWEEVEKGGMPLKGYVKFHQDAVLSPADKELLKAWSESMKAERDNEQQQENEEKENNEENVAG